MEEEPRPQAVTRHLLLWPTPILVGIAIALASVLIGNGVGAYGFPFAWKTGGCLPPGIVFSTSCFLAIGYDWLGFGLDALLYATVGYALFFLYTKYAARIRIR